MLSAVNTLKLSIVLAAGISAPAFAQCAIPNALSNGQVADATEVMENFEAVADCADAASASAAEAVLPSGAPQPGNIAVFADGKTITSGDLSGDVTTAGGTDTTLSDTGVVPGTYVNANIVVDSKGRVTAAEDGSAGGGSGSADGYTTLVYEPQFTLAAGETRDIDLTFANSLTVIARNITKSASGYFVMRFSVDGGSTWVSSPHYIVDINAAGNVGYNHNAIYSDGTSTGQRTHYLHVPDLKSQTPKIFLGSRAGVFDNAGQITHIRIYSSAGAITGGSLTVLAR